MVLSARTEGSAVAALSAIITGALVLQMANTVMQTVLPLRMALENEPPLLIGFVGSAYSVGYLAGCFAIPSLISRIGHIRGFAVFAALQAALTLSFPVMPVEAWGPARLLMGCAAAGHGICIESWISGQARSGHTGRIFGFYQILSRLVVIGSQVAVGYIAVETENVFLLVSAAFSLALIPVGLTRAHGPEFTEIISVNLRMLWQQAPAAVIGCLYVGLVGGPLTSVAPAYGILIGLDQSAAILLTASVQIGALVAQWPMGWFADRFDSRLVMSTAVLAVLGASLLLCCIHLFTGRAPDVWLYGLFLVIGAGGIPIYTVAVAHAYLRVGREHAVSLSAGLLFLWAAGAGIGPVAATSVMEVIGPQGLLAYVGALSLLVAVYLMVRMSRKPRPDAGDIKVPPVASPMHPSFAAATEKDSPT
ncbi:MFS transporter [Rhodoligotrophos ferricapiens]|uniref:MFS transporter n=1 Tax=Rhodoligotrophos ferricapiens TaxID=3069264 RepID=UPI00315CAA41